MAAPASAGATLRGRLSWPNEGDGDGRTRDWRHLLPGAGPDALNAWYREHLGIGAGCVADGAGDPDEWSWQTRGGPVVFAPFKASTDYFAADKQYMLNLRVEGLDDMIAALTSSGIVVETREEWTATEAGSFARILDPEGNAIELWEPPTGS